MVGNVADNTRGAQHMNRIANGNHVADICLFGTQRTGAGFLGVVFPHGQTFGTGDPVAGRSFTEAVWLAQADVRRLGVTSGKVRVFHPGGEFVSVIDVNDVRTFGSLTSEPAPVFTISMEGSAR